MEAIVTMQNSSGIEFNFSMVRILATGKIGCVYLAQSKEPLKCSHRATAQFVVKTFTSVKPFAATFWDNCLELVDLNHENIIHFYDIGQSMEDVVKNGHKLFILEEFCSGGTLTELAISEALSVERLRNYFKQVINGLCYLHDNRIIHCDLRGTNILLTKDASVAKIGGVDDYSRLEHSLTGPTDVSQKKGTVPFMSPEMVRFQKGLGEAVGRKSDIWSLGCVLLEVQGRGSLRIKDTMGRDTSTTSDTHLQMIIWEGGRPHIPNDLPASLKEVVQQCLIEEQANRPSAADLRKHSFCRTQEVPPNVISPPVIALQGVHSTVSHTRFRCSACGQSPISGTRYKCLQCTFYNLCTLCEQKGLHAHDMVALRKSCTSRHDNNSCSCNSSSATEHRNIICDGCGMQPIIGTRYKCAECSNYDLCRSCESKATHKHNMYTIREPGDNSKIFAFNGTRAEQQLQLQAILLHMGNEEKKLAASTTEPTRVVKDLFNAP